MESNYYDNNYYEVEKIISRKKIKGKIYYLIKWLCYSISDCTWEPYENLENINEMIKTFENRYPKSIDKKMYKIFKNTNKTKNEKEIKKFLNKKKERKEILNDIKNNKNVDSPYEDSSECLDLLKSHLYIKNSPDKRRENLDDKKSKNTKFNFNELKSSIKVDENRKKFHNISLKEKDDYCNSRKNEDRLVNPILF